MRLIGISTKATAINSMDAELLAFNTGELVNITQPVLLIALFKSDVVFRIFTDKGLIDISFRSGITIGISEPNNLT